MYKNLLRPIYLAVQLLMWLVFGLWGQQRMKVIDVSDTVTVWRIDSLPFDAETVWANVLKCSMQDTLPGHGLKSVTWLRGTLLRDDSAHSVIGFWQSDTIIIDTTVLSSWPRYWDVPKHELVHHVLHNRVPKLPRDSNWSRNLARMPDTVHPFFPFVQPCRVMFWQSHTAADTL